MDWVEAFHIISVVAWFAGLFYLPRLFVYHAMANDQISLDRFKDMERRLYYAITTPAAILTTIFGLWLLFMNLPYYMQQGWALAKFALVIVLWIYHIYCGKLVKDFKYDRNTHGHRFYRWFNEFPTVLLILIIILVVVKP